MAGDVADGDCAYEFAPDANELGQAAGVVLIGLVALRLLGGCGPNRHRSSFEAIEGVCVSKLEP
ncbi:MAG: hypothetical protein WBX25_16795 [Rhodomicrobium sp.]